MQRVDEMPAIQCCRVRLSEVELDVSQAGSGDGPLVVLLHGFPESRRMWDPVLAAIAARGCVALAPDQRGYGRSSKPRGIASYDLDRLAGDITELAAAFGRRRFGVIGHDWGAAVGWWIASMFPHQIERLLALSAPHPAAWRHAMLEDPDQKQRSGYVRLLRTRWLPEILIRARDYEPLARPLEPLISPDQLAGYREAWQQEGALTGMINWYRALLKHDFAPLRSYRVDIPVLFAAGSLDPYLASSAVGMTAGICSKLDYVPLEGRGHWLIQEDPGTVATLLAAFLEMPASKMPHSSASARS